MAHSAQDPVGLGIEPLLAYTKTTPVSTWILVAEEAGETLTSADQGKRQLLTALQRQRLYQRSPRAAPVLNGAFMNKFGGDSIPETRSNSETYLKTVGPREVYQ